MPRSLNAGVVTGVVVGHSGVTLMARLLGQNGQPVTQASLSAIAWKAFDLNAGSQLGAGTFALAASIFDSLQQSDPRWTRDSAAAPGPDALWGFNFLGVVPAATFPAAVILPAAAGWPVPQPRANKVQCEVAFTPVAGEIFRAVYQWTPIQVFS